MSTVKEIETAILALPAVDLGRLREWFIDLDASKWDEEFERDARNGSLDTVAAEAIAEYRAGKCTPL